MSPAGYVRYLEVTLSKMRQRQAGREKEIEHVASNDFSGTSNMDDLPRLRDRRIKC